MKKFLLILLLVLSPILVTAEEKVDVKIKYVNGVYWNYEKENILYSGKFSYFYVNDRIAYSMDITTPFVSNEYISTNKELSSNLIYKYAYFGYGYKDNNSLEDYMATQKILWKYTDSAKVYFTTEPNGQGNVIDISINEAKIKKIVNDYSRFPEYNKLKFVIGTNNIISNENDIKDKLILENLSKNDISIDLNNSLSFNANEVGIQKFSLQKIFDYKYENIFYVSDNSPELLVVGKIDDIKKRYTYEVIGGTININVKFDKEKNNDITNNQFKLYNSSNNLIGIYSPNKDGNINISNLIIDTYILKHEKITEGYDLENKEYKININENNLNIEKDITLNLKRSKLVINKTYSNIFTNNLEYDTNVSFKIYDENNNYINECITNENGKIETYLEYGNYKIVGNEKDNFIIDKSMFNDVIEYNIHDKIYNSNLKIITLDKNTNEKLSNTKFKINDKEYMTNEDGIYVFNNMNFGLYKIENFESSNIRNMNTIVYELNENSDVYIENKEPYVDIYLYLNNNIIKEEINKEEDKVIDKENSNDLVIEDEFVVKDDKKDSVKNDVEINNNLEANDKEQDDLKINDTIDNSNQNKEDNYNSLELEEINKLPFLGDNINKNENSKVITYIINIIRFNWM